MATLACYRRRPTARAEAQQLCDPPMIETTTVHLPELRFMRHSLLSAWNAS